MNQIMISIAAISILATASNASWIGALKADKKVANVKLSVGQATFEDESSILYTLEIGGNYYYNNGLLWGAQFGFGYTKNPDETVSTTAMGEINGQFKLGYSFGATAKGLGIYGLYDMSYLMYNYNNLNQMTGELEDEINFATGMGFGAGAEYIFDSGWIVTASYSTMSMSPDIGSEFDYSKALVGVGYTW